MHKSDHTTPHNRSEKGNRAKRRSQARSHIYTQLLDKSSITQPSASHPNKGINAKRYEGDTILYLKEQREEEERRKKLLKQISYSSIAIDMIGMALAIAAFSLLAYASLSGQEILPSTGLLFLLGIGADVGCLFLNQLNILIKIRNSQEKVNPLEFLKAGVTISRMIANFVAFCLMSISGMNADLGVLYIVTNSLSLVSSCIDLVNCVRDLSSDKNADTKLSKYKDIVLTSFSIFFKIAYLTFHTLSVAGVTSDSLNALIKLSLLSLLLLATICDLAIESGKSASKENLKEEKARLIEKEGGEEEVEEVLINQTPESLGDSTRQSDLLESHDAALSSGGTLRTPLAQGACTNPSIERVKSDDQPNTHLTQASASNSKIRHTPQIASS